MSSSASGGPTTPARAWTAAVPASALRSRSRSHRHTVGPPTPPTGLKAVRRSRCGSRRRCERSHPPHTVVTRRVVHPRPGSVQHRTRLRGERLAMNQRRIAAIVVGALLATGLVGLSPAAGANAAAPARYAPKIDPRDFGGAVDNPWFPLVPGTRWTYAVK